MSKISDDLIVTRLLEDITAAEVVSAKESIDNAVIYQLYRAKKMGNEVAGRSQLVSSDVFEVVEWLSPALCDIFSEANGVPSFTPVGKEDELPTELMSELIKYQFYRQNNGEDLMLDVTQDALMYRPGGIVKWRWEKKGRTETKNLESLTSDETLLLAAHKDVKIKKYNERDDGAGYDLTAERTFVDYDGPRFELLAPWEFLRHPNYKDIETSPFVAHKKKVTVDYLRRMEKLGFYKNVDEAIEGGAPVLGDDYTEQKIHTADGYSRESEPSSDEARQEVELYECYVQLDTDDDGLLNNRIICLVGRTIIRNVENVYGRPPFSVMKCIKDTHKFSGIPIAEYMIDLQRLNTFLLRQTVDNIDQSNNSRKVYNPKVVNMGDLLDNRPGASIRIKDGVDVRTAITELPTNPVNASVMTFFGICKELGEQRTGVSKAFKSVGDVHNQTASGQDSAIQQASTRVRKMAKIMASGWADLFRAMIMMNHKFMTESLSIRITSSKYLEMSPEDLEGRMDINVNVLMGSNSKQQQINNMQQLIAIGGQIMQLGVPILDQKNTAKMFEEIIKNMGYRDTEQFMPQAIQQGGQDPNQPQEGSSGSNFPSTGADVNSLNQLAGGATGAPAVPGGANVTPQLPPSAMQG